MALSNEELAPGVAQTAAEARAGLVSSAATAAAQQVDAGRFIAENGHDVVGGHADVGAVSGRDVGGTPG